MNHKDFGIGKREIKFRAWDPRDRYMASWERLGARDELSMGYDMNEKGDSFFTLNDNLVWMQYTGLKDKNGVEIYEGDVADLTFDTYNDGEKTERVVISSMRGAMKLDGNVWNDGMPYYEGGTNYDWGVCEEIKVIGNVFQHPNLLKDESNN